jgi:soluble lytic murein transglycosylase-like protein
MAQAKKNIPKDLFDLFSNLSGEYGVPLDYIITTAYIESGFKPKAGNTKYKGMFALSQSEFNKYYPSGDIYNIEQNSRAGVQVLKERVKEAKTIFNQYKSYFK